MMSDAQIGLAEVTYMRVGTQCIIVAVSGREAS
jgi:hypothetical protein